MSTHRCKEAVGRDFYVLHKLGVYCVCVQSATECGKVFVVSRTNECKVLYTLGKPSSQTCYKVRDS